MGDLIVMVFGAAMGLAGVCVVAAFVTETVLWRVRASKRKGVR